VTDPETTQPVRLTPKRREFVRQYVALNNGAAAARMAGYAVASADREAFRLLSSADIQRALSEYRASIADRLGVTPERIISELATIAFADLGDYVRIVRGEPILDLSELRPGLTRALASVDQTKDGIRFRLHDKHAALVTLARAFGMLGAGDSGVSVVVNQAESVELATLSTAELRRGVELLALSDGESRPISAPNQVISQESPSRTAATGATEGSDDLISGAS